MCLTLDGKVSNFMESQIILNYLKNQCYQLDSMCELNRCFPLNMHALKSLQEHVGALHDKIGLGKLLLLYELPAKRDTFG